MLNEDLNAGNEAIHVHKLEDEQPSLSSPCYGSCCGASVPNGQASAVAAQHHPHVNGDGQQRPLWAADGRRQLSRSDSDLGRRIVSSISRATAVRREANDIKQLEGNEHLF